MHYSTGTNLKMMLYTHHEISMRDEIPWIVALLLRLQRVRITFMHYSTGTNLEMLLSTHYEISMRKDTRGKLHFSLRLQRVRITFMHYSTGTNLEMLLSTHHEISMTDEHPWTVALFIVLATSAHYFHALFNRNKLGNVAVHAS